MEKSELIIDCALYKKIKSMDRETTNNFVQNVYQQGCKAVKSHSIDYDKLRADLSLIKGIGGYNDRLYDRLGKDKSVKEMRQDNAKEH